MPELSPKEMFEINVSNMAFLLSPKKKISLCFNEIGSEENEWPREKLEGNGWKRDPEYKEYYCLKNARDTTNYTFIFDGEIRDGTNIPLQFNGEIEDAIYFPGDLDCEVYTYEGDDHQKISCRFYYD